jgi:hypothetical protein
VTSASLLLDRDSSFVSDEFITAPSLKEKVICLRLAASQHRAQQKTGTLVAPFFFDFATADYSGLQMNAGASW